MTFWTSANVVYDIYGGAQVKSGLEKPEKHVEFSTNERVRVSPYRIAFHWTGALALYGGTLWPAG